MKIKIWRIVVDTSVQKRSRPNLTDKLMAVGAEQENMVYDGDFLKISDFFYYEVLINIFFLIN